MSRRITRIRRTPGGWDEYGDPVPSTETATTLRPRAIAPGSSRAETAHGRDGETVEWTIYFTRAVDITDDDLLEIDGRRYRIRVAPWESAYGTGRRGTVIEATRREG